MTPPARCRECGDRKPLTPTGVCRYRGGCEHRQMVHAVTMARLNAAFDHPQRLAMHAAAQAMLDQIPADALEARAMMARWADARLREWYGGR